jgi:hypothetical protein
VQTKFKKKKKKKKTKAASAEPGTAGSKKKKVHRPVYACGRIARDDLRNREGISLTANPTGFKTLAAEIRTSFDDFAAYSRMLGGSPTANSTILSSMPTTSTVSNIFG